MNATQLLSNLTDVTNVTIVINQQALDALNELLSNLFNTTLNISVTPSGGNVRDLVSLVDDLIQTGVNSTLTVGDVVMVAWPVLAPLIVVSSEFIIRAVVDSPLGQADSEAAADDATFITTIRQMARELRQRGHSGNQFSVGGLDRGVRRQCCLQCLHCRCVCAAGRKPRYC